MPSKVPITLYSYNKCSTCRNALKFLEAANIDADVKDIVETPPTKTDLKKMLKFQGEIKKLFNTSGILYREMKLKEKLPSLSQDDALRLLSEHGKLVKRPFFLSEDHGLVGFKKEEWAKLC